jgi:antitoxin component YwqK of YwqJK toxin-antitoxin module
MEDSVKEKGLTLSVAVHEICVGPIKEGQTVKRTRFNDDKKLIEEYFVKRHKGQFVKHGSFKQFHANGKMSRFANYKDGELHGKHFYYNKDGSEREASRYLAGKKHGEYKRWNDKKQLVEEGHYEHDKKHGMWKQYRKGKIDMEVEYKKGKYVKKTTY